MLDCFTVQATVTEAGLSYPARFCSLVRIDV